MSLVFFSMASSLVLFVLGHGVETSNLGDVSAQKLCQGSADFSLEQVGIDVSAPCTYCNAPARMKVIHLISTRPNMQKARERFKTIRSLCVVCVVFLQCYVRKGLRQRPLQPTLELTKDGESTWEVKGSRAIRNRLKTLRKLCPLDFIHTFYSHSYIKLLKSWTNSSTVSRTSPDTTALKRNRYQ